MEEESDRNLGFGIGTKRDSEGIGEKNSATVIKKPRVDGNDDDQEEEEEERKELKLEIDLNVSVMEVDDESNGIGVGFDLNREVIDISSDDDDDEKVEEIEMLGQECSPSLNLRLGVNDGDDGGDGSSVSVKKRSYSREEKGKAKVDDDDQLLLLSLASEIPQPDVDRDIELDPQPDVDRDMELAPQPDVDHDMELVPQPDVNLDIELAPQPDADRDIELAPQPDADRDIELGNAGEGFAPLQRLVAVVAREYQAERLKSSRIRRARNYALPSSSSSSSSSKDDLCDVKLEKVSGTFSAELKAIIDRNTAQKAQNLIEWSAHRLEFRPRIAPSLLDLSLNVLARNADVVSSFEYVPDWLKRRLVNLLCDVHKMDVRILDLLFRGSPTEIRVKNCSWMTEKQLVDMLKKSDLRNLRVLQLDNCGQCSFDDIICNALALPPNSLASLGILSLRGAARLSDDTFKHLISINLGQSALLTCDGIEILADSLKTNLKELYIDQCPRIDAMRSLSSMMKFKHLEVLSVAEIPTVNDDFVMGITASFGRTLKELNLAGCVMLTDASLQAIGSLCSVLCSLNISNLHHVTDLGLCYLADGCRSLESLNISRADFSDVVVAAFLETSGGSLKELSLNHVRKVSFNSAFALAKFSRKLISLDLSWCRQITDEALGFITDNCSSLKLLKIFGCTQITETFVRGRANSQVHVLGRDSLSVLDHVNMFDPVEVLLQYSPLETPALPHNDGIKQKEN
ncbi:hypothetical protein OSB04_014785 [Centaurea solstitialis]|uniref:F-box/LRR-repeat protein 15-like leucin rich repeat domain-containing protein n=1 Tax=Centaurea solstitialis TaxID=347529 RepID=A0AA38SXR0_9ASTR|nr:hypothetical protein OSB04_014785 [Centaurea solstitialis]